MTYTESIRFLYSLQKFGMKFGLVGIRALLHAFDHPEKLFPTIHIAGTNGKGSTASMIASVFTASGYKTGLYTSPHLVSFNERIRINGKPIPSRYVARLVSAIHRKVKRKKCTFFETATAVAFQYFAESKVDIAIIETGLGGRLDATNVIRPLVSVITSIGMEHTRILGTSIEDIASEKGGIIKRGVPCVTGVQSRKALGVLRKTCSQKLSPLIRVQSKNIVVKHSSLKGITADFLVAGNSRKNITVSLAGRHQAMNALLALNTVEIVSKKSEFKVGEKALRKGLSNIRRFAGLQARLSVIRRKPLILADVAHNPEAVKALCASLRQLGLVKIHIVFGLMEDKNFRQIIAMLQKVAASVFIVEAHTERSRSSDELAEVFRQYRIIVREITNVVGGIKSAIRKNDGRPILITGSHFVVGEAIAFLGGEKYLTINQ